MVDMVNEKGVYAAGKNGVGRDVLYVIESVREKGCTGVLVGSCLAWSMFVVHDGSQKSTTTPNRLLSRG